MLPVKIIKKIYLFVLLLSLVLLTGNVAAVTIAAVTITAEINTQEATNVSETSAKLHGKIALDKPYEVVSYFFEYGLSTAYGSKNRIDTAGQGALQTDVDGDVFDLSCGRDFHYRLVVSLKETADSNVVLNVGNDAVFMTAECPPAILLDFSVVATDRENATLTVAFDGHGQEVDVYYLWGSTEELSQQTPIQIGNYTLLTQLRDLVCGSPYYYAVVLQNSTTDITSSTKKFNTKLCSQVPTAATTSAENILKNSAKINASVAPNEAPTSVYFEWGLGVAYSNNSTPVAINGGYTGEIISLDLSGLGCGQEYYYRVIAENENGKVSGQGLTFTTAACDSVDQTTPNALLSAKIFAGSNNTIAIGKSGEVLSWGDNRFFQLGGVTEGFDFIDGVKTISNQESILPILDVLEAAVGGEHSLLLHDLGVIISFGNNDVGQLGVATQNLPPDLPVYLVDDVGARIDQFIGVDAGDKHSIALKEDGSVLLWGDNSFGQLGVENVASSVKPITMTTITNASQIAAGDNYNLAVLQDRTLVAWGENNSGQLGIGTSSDLEGVTVVSGAEDVISLAAGAEHVLALKENGELLVWGNNQSGQLGIGNTEDEYSPVLLELDDFQRIDQIAAGDKHSVILLSDGTLLAWGDNTLGQLGIATAGNAYSPTQVVDASQEKLKNIVSISAGANFTVAVDTQGHIISWGDNSMGQLNGLASADTQSRMVKDKFDTDLLLNTPRIIINKAELIIPLNELARLEVRLSSRPNVDVTVTISLSEGQDGFIVDRRDEINFTTNSLSWSAEQEKTILSQGNSAVTQGMLRFTAPGFASVEVPIRTSKNVVEKPKAQVVGATPPVFILLLLLFLIRRRF